MVSLSIRQFLMLYCCASLTVLYCMLARYINEQRFTGQYPRSIHRDSAIYVSLREAGLVTNELVDDDFGFYKRKHLDRDNAERTRFFQGEVKEPYNVSDTFNLSAPLWQERDNLKKIIWYDIAHDGHGLRNKGKFVDFALCPYSRCARLPDFIIDDNNSDKAALDSADAVVVQAVHYTNFATPVPRRPGQIFIFAERESGWIIGCNDTMDHPKYKNVFNWTMTFRRDSDIPMLYGDILDRDKPARKLLTEDWRKLKKKTERTKSFDKVFADKQYEVAWLVSHCTSNSYREYYIEELRKYIPVEIIGGCGKRKCPKHDSSECLSKIEKQFKFILSFENTFHTDYATEKLYDWIGKDIIQVVFGLADYFSIAPRGTVINAANFVSPQHLANYLKDVGSNKQKYVHYLRRKAKVFSVGHVEMQQRAYCRLCDMLHHVDANTWTHPNVATWWQRKNQTRINNFVYENVTGTAHLCNNAR